MAPEQGTTEDAQQATPRPPSLWLLKLVLPGRYGRKLTSALIFCVLLAIFYVAPGDGQPANVPALFFSLVIAYIIPVFSYITERSLEAVEQLKPQLRLGEADVRRLQDNLRSAPLPATLGYLLLGTLLGGTHVSFLSGSPAGAIERMSSSVPDLLSIAGTLMVWIVLTTVSSMLIRQAMIIGRLGREHVRCDLINAQSLLPFGRVATSSSLAIIGALALFPLIGAENGVDFMEILPGAFAMLVPLVVIFLVPIWPVHRRMSVLKEKTLDALNRRIDNRISKDGEYEHDLPVDPELTSLLVFRREVLEVSTWPFNLGNVTRLALYLFIPPLTWVAAALIEKVVDAAL